MENIAQILSIASYILEVEETLDKEKLALGPEKGWEHYLKNRRTTGLSSYRDAETLGQWFLNIWRVEYSKARIVLWILLIGLTFALFASSFIVQLSSCAAPKPA